MLGVGLVGDPNRRGGLGRKRQFAARGPQGLALYDRPDAVGLQDAEEQLGFERIGGLRYTDH
jgi:hypothetical protein